MSPSRFVLLAMLALSLVPAVGARADELIPPKVLVRRFPQGQFCALPVTISFVAPTTPVTVTFTAVEFVDDDGTPTWTHQDIDNVTVAPTAVVTPNFEGPPTGSSSANCYVGDPEPVMYFHFNRAGLAIDLLERFDDNPGPRGWDLSQGAFFDASRSGPRNVEGDLDFTGGSLGLGDGSGTPVVGATASTSISLSGLTAGTSYDIGAWWYAGFVHFPFDQDYLTITVTTDNATVLARKSWGSVKSGYR